MRNLPILLVVVLSAVLLRCELGKPTTINILIVESAYGSPTPHIGRNYVKSGLTITASVDSPVEVGEGIYYACTGWNGTGSVPSIGTENSVTFIITENSSISWKWAVRSARNWTQRAPNGITLNPLPTSGCTLTYDSNRGVCVLFGGDTEGSTITSTNATWEWYDNIWTQKFPATLPPARQRHSAAFDAARSVTVIFGGMGSDTWTWDGSDWTQQNPTVSPQARGYHAMVYDSSRNVVVMFGGYSGTAYLNDTWEWNGTDWTEKTPANEPSARAYHAMAFDSCRNKVVLFGGYNGADNDDTWEYDGTDWTQVSTACAPEPMSWPSMAYDSVRRVIVLFGGYGATYFDETWEYNGTTWVQVITNSVPSARHSHEMCYDVYRNVTLLFGGSNGDYYKDDTWEY